MTKVFVIYHAECLDGFGAAYAAWKKYPDAEFYAAKYGQEPPIELLRDAEVYILDFSYPLGAMRAIIAEAAKVTVLDHHKTARDALAVLLEAKECHGEFDMNRSGSVMAWQWFFGDPVPEMLLHIQDRDLWRFNMKDTKEIAAALYSRKMEMHEWEWLSDNLSNLAEEGTAILRSEKKKVEMLVNSGLHFADIGGHYVPVVNAPFFMASDICHELLRRMPDAGFVATYSRTGDDIVYSLRSTDDRVDVSEIAKKYDGGGHRNAAGFKYPAAGKVSFDA